MRRFVVWSWVWAGCWAASAECFSQDSAPSPSRVIVIETNTDDGEAAAAPQPREIGQPVEQVRSVAEVREPGGVITFTVTPRIIVSDEEEALLGMPEGGLRVPEELLSTANAERQKLIQSLQALQDAYCRAAQLDEAVEVREMIRQLNIQGELARTLTEPVSPPVTAEVKAPPPGLDDAVELSALRGQNGTTIYCRVIGQTSGALWGGTDNVYTDDSDLATAAVHAGVLKAGETGIVRVTIGPGLESYAAITRNAVESSHWHDFGGSYRIDGAGVEHLNAYSLRGQDVAPFAAYVVGSTAGTVYGSGTYSDDSDIATAAVHAGLLKAGEAGFVQVTLVGGQSSYDSTTQNGVTTVDYGNWYGSYRLSAYDASQPTGVIDVPQEPQPVRFRSGGIEITR